MNHDTGFETDTLHYKKIILIGNNANSLINFRGSLIKALIDSGVQVFALSPAYTPEEKLAVEQLGAQALTYPLSRTGVNPLQDLKTLLALRSILLRIKPDVTLAYFAKPVIWGILAAWLAAVPRRVAMIEGLGFAFTDDGRPPSIKRRLLRSIVTTLYRLALARAHRVLLLNRDDLAELTRLGLVRADQAENIGGIGVDLAQWPQMPLPSGPFTFALAARMLREKGVLDFVAAARLIKQKHPSVRFLLLGGLDENPGALARADVQQWVDEGIVEWPGHVPMLPWLSQCSVYVLPSYREGLPRSTQEAMAIGRPVITTDVPGCRDTVIEGVNGYLVPPRNPAALAAAMQRFVSNPALVATMGAQSRRLAEERFDVHKVNQKIMAVLGFGAAGSSDA